MSMGPVMLGVLELLCRRSSTPAPANLAPLDRGIRAPRTVPDPGGALCV